MAKVQKWKETLVLAFAALLLSVTQAWPRGTCDAASNSYPGLAQTADVCGLRSAKLSRPEWRGGWPSSTLEVIPENSS